MFRPRHSNHVILLAALSSVMPIADLAPVGAATTFFPLTLWRLKPTINGGASKSDAMSDAPPAAAERFGYIEYKPNGTLILRSTAETGSNLQNLLLLKTVLSAIKLASKNSANQPNGTTIGSLKLYGDGVEHKFPPFLERILQRIQTYFSVYKYADTSRPLALTAQLAAPQKADEAQVVADDAWSTGAVDIGSDGGGILQTTGNIMTAPTGAYTGFISIATPQRSATDSSATTVYQT